MALDKKHLEEIADKLKIGQILKLTSRFNEKETRTPTIKDKSFEEISDPKNWLELVRAIYAKNAAHFKSGKIAVAAKKGTKDTFIIVDSNENTSIEVKVKHTPTSVIIESLTDRKKTIIEKADVVKSKKESDTPGNFYEDLIKFLKTKKPKNPDEAMKAIEELVKAAKK